LKKRGVNRNRLRTVRDFVRARQVVTDILGAIALDVNVGKSEATAGGILGTVNANSRLLTGDGTGDVIKSDLADRQGAVVVLGAERHLVLVTVVGGDNNRVFDIIELNVLVDYILNNTLSTGPCLDSDTVLTVGTDRVQDTDELNRFLLATLTKRANTETVTTITLDVR
jgi:hypothetical protein